MRIKGGKKWHMVVLFVVIIVLFLYNENNGLGTTVYNVTTSKLPAEAEGLTIVQLSDLHNKLFGDNQSRLVRRVARENPDIIVLTGDLVDSRRYQPEHALTLVDKLTELAPIYYVTGNHERRIQAFPDFEQELLERKVRVLRNESELIEVPGGVLRIVGVDDPTFKLGFSSDRSEMRQRLKLVRSQWEEQMVDDVEPFTLLLSHRPELVDLYADYGMDVILSGHAHGGQIRIPFVGGIIAPNQGFFPPYTSGMHEVGYSHLIVSRGLGNSSFPLRLFNKPEVVVVKLHAQVENE